MYRISPSLRGYALALGAGMATATVWVNLAPERYYDAIEWRLLDAMPPGWLPPDLLLLTPASVCANLLMALFVFFIAKELWEAVVLESGPLKGRQLALPLGGVAGASLGAVLIWAVLARGDTSDMAYGASAGWPVPVGSDVLLAYVVGQRVFRTAPGALHLLLLSMIGCDLAALMLMAVAMPPEPALRWLWALLPLAASLGVWMFYGRRPDPRAPERQRQRGLRLWPYCLAGIVSYFGVLAAGLPASLGLLPIIPAIPHAARSFGLFADAETVLHDPLNRMSQGLRRPLVGVVAFYGVTHGGIDLQAFAPLTLTVLAAAWLGKPLGYLFGTILAARLLRVPLPAGVSGEDLVLVALLLGMGFTVPALTLATLPGGGMQEAARLGLALTLLAGPAAMIAARLLRPGVA